MNVKIEVIPHKDQRYPTVGDWYYEPGPPETIVIRVSDMGNWKYEMLVAVHELFEVLVCRQNGVTQEMVDKFDMEFEKERTLRMEKADPEDRALIAIEEPGDDPAAPYAFEHCSATGVERILASELGVSWSEYESTLESLP